MNITLSVEDDLVRTVRRIAVERDTTLSAMVREYLQAVVSEDSAHGRKRRERTALERSFEAFRIRIGRRDWRREDLYERR
jgi:hypothetical protein